MRAWGVWVAVVTYLVLVSDAVPRAHAYCRVRTDTARDGVCEVSSKPALFWRRDCLSYIFHDDLFAALPLLSENATRDVVNDAFSAWLSVDCGVASFQVDQLAGTTDGPPLVFRPGQRNEFVISAMGEDEWLAWELEPDAYAMTHLWYRSRSGEIVDVDLVLNLSHGHFGDCAAGCRPGTIDLQNTLTHEAGHVFGLGHTKVDGATMEADATVGATHMRTLEQDDIAGLCAIALPSHICDDPADCSCPPPPIYPMDSGGCSVGGGRVAGAPQVRTLLLLALALSAMRGLQRVGRRHV